MIEAIVTASVAAIAGVAKITNRLQARINHVHDRIELIDRRIDGVELRIAEKYVTKADLAAILRSMEEHMVRIIVSSISGYVFVSVSCTHSPSLEMMTVCRFPTSAIRSRDVNLVFPFVSFLLMISQQVSHMEHTYGQVSL